MKMVIPIMVQPTTENYYWVKNVLAGMRSGAARYDCEMLTLDRNAIQKGCLAKGMPILVNGHMEEWLSDTAEFLARSGYAPIIVNSSIVLSRKFKYSGVRFDLESGIRDIVEYCIADGRRNMALFGVRPDLSGGDREKTQLFLQKAREYCLTEPRVCCLGNSLDACIDEFITCFFDNSIDAVICANDTIAILLIQEMLKNGIRIPDDLYVFGVGNSPVGQWLGVPLISLKVDYFEMGKQAVRLWRYLYRDGMNVDITVSVFCQLNVQNAKMDALTQQADKEDAVERICAHCRDWDDFFYEDERVNRLLKLEALLRECDEVDLALLEAVKNGKTDESVADEIYLSSRAVRYRFSKLIKKAGVQDRGQLVALLKEFLKTL